MSLAHETDFLAPMQELSIENFRAANQRLGEIIDAPFEGLELLEEQGGNAFGALSMAQVDGLVVTAHETEAISVRDPRQSLDAVAKATARRSVSLNLMLDGITKIVALQTGIAEATGDVLEVMRGNDYGHELIRHKASYGLLQLAQVMAMIHEPHTVSGESVSIWERAVKTHEAAHKLAVPVLHPMEERRLQVLMQRQKSFSEIVTPIASEMAAQASTDPIDNEWRAMEDAENFKNDPELEATSEIEFLRAAMKQSFPIDPPRFEDEETRDLRTSISRFAGFLGRAAAYDDSILADSRLRALRYMDVNLQGFNILGEDWSFAAMVKKVSSKIL